MPDDIGFATRSQLATDMITAAVQAGAPARWVAADEAYGNSSVFRAELRNLRLGYVLAVSRSHLVPLDDGKVRQHVDRVAAGLPASAWQRRSAGAGSKGPRLYHWAWLGEVSTDADPDDGGHHSILIRRNSTTGELAFYRCWTPQPATLAELVRVAGIRWSVEEAFQTAKGQVGLDQHQVRRWHLRYCIFRAIFSSDVGSPCYRVLEICRPMIHICPPARPAELISRHSTPGVRQSVSGRGDGEFCRFGSRRGGRTR